MTLDTIGYRVGPAIFTSWAEAFFEWEATEGPLSPSKPKEDAYPAPANEMPLRPCQARTGRDLVVAPGCLSRLGRATSLDRRTQMGIRTNNWECEECGKVYDPDRQRDDCPHAETTEPLGARRRETLADLDAAKEAVVREVDFALDPDLASSGTKEQWGRVERAWRQYRDALSAALVVERQVDDREVARRSFAR